MLSYASKELLRLPSQRTDPARYLRNGYMHGMPAQQGSPHDKFGRYHELHLGDGLCNTGTECLREMHKYT